MTKIASSVAVGALLAMTVPVFAAPAKSQEVRVLVAENQKSLTLTVKGRYQIKLLPSLLTAAAGQKLKTASVAATPAGIRIGGKELKTPGFRIEPAANNDLWMNQSRFRGSLDVRKNPDGTLRVINRVPLEEYLYGVLHHEVAPWWPMEALKAQAVAARTYAVYQASVSQGVEYDLKSSTSSQVYGGSTRERYRTKKAVDDTKGQLLKYLGKVFPAYFHATCAGKTAGAQELWKINLPPIAGGVLCDHCQISPHYYWHAKIPLSEIEEKMNANGRRVGQVLNVEVVTQTPSGRAGSLQITGNAGSVLVAAKDFRVWMGGNRIRGAFFTVKAREDMADFDGKGWGHGVGLCQWGALGQALLGKTYKEILHFYYPGSEIV
ncbi:MAG: SpoIID/LytB domain-containing protein [Candidatus Omnitrophica bacterium]|nr:SpoIID/LytB domain-containing protein [Candidatus Omnitrophota bacterium]